LFEPFDEKKQELTGETKQDLWYAVTSVQLKRCSTKLICGFLTHTSKVHARFDRRAVHFVSERLEKEDG